MEIDPAASTSGEASREQVEHGVEKNRVRKEVAFETQVAESMARRRMIPRAKVPRTAADPRPSTLYGSSFLGSVAPRNSEAEAEAPVGYEVSRSARRSSATPSSAEHSRMRRRSSLPTTGLETLVSQTNLVNSWLKEQDVETQEKILIESWLDRMLARVLSTASTGTLQAEGTGGLESSGLDRQRLMFSGLESEHVDLVYRVLYAHTAGFYDMLKGGKGFDVDDENTEKIMVAFKLLTSHLQRWGGGEGLVIGQRRKSLGERRDRVGSVVRKETADFELRSKMEVRLMLMARELEREKQLRQREEALIQELRKRISDLEAELAAMRDLYNKLKAEMDQTIALLQEEMDRLRKQVLEQQNEILALKELLRQKDLELAELRESMRVMQESFNSKALADAEALSKMYEERIGKLEKELSDLLSELARLRASELEAWRQRDALQELYEFESTRNALLRLQIEELLKGRDKMNADAALADQKMHDMAQIIAQQEAEINSLRAALERANELLARLQGVEQENLALKEKLKEYERISESLKALDQAMKGVTGDTSPDATWFGERAESLQRNGMKVLFLLDAANDTVRLLQEKLEDRNRLVQLLQDQLARALEAAAALEIRLQEALEQGASKDAYVSGLEDKLKNMTDELERLRRLLAELQAKYDALERSSAMEIERLKLELQALREELALEKQKAADALKALKEQMDLVAALREQLQNALNKIEEQRKLLEEQARQYEMLLNAFNISKANNHELEDLIDALRRELALLRQRLHDEAGASQILEEERRLLLEELQNLKREFELIKQELQDTIQAFIVDMNSLREIMGQLQETKVLLAETECQGTAAFNAKEAQPTDLTVAGPSSVPAEAWVQTESAGALVPASLHSPTSPRSPRMMEQFQGGLSDPKTRKLKTEATEVYLELQRTIEEKNQALRALEAAMRDLERQVALYGPHVTALVNLLWRVWQMATDAQKIHRELVAQLLQLLVEFWNSLGDGIRGDDETHLQYTEVLKTLQEMASMTDLEMDAQRTIANELQGHLHNLPPLPHQETEFRAQQLRLRTASISQFQFSIVRGPSTSADDGLDESYMDDEMVLSQETSAHMHEMSPSEARLLTNVTPKDLQEVVDVGKRIAVERITLQKEVQRLQAQLLAEQAARKWRDKYTRELFDKLMGKGKVSRAAQTAASDFWTLLIPHPLSAEETDMLEFRTYWRKLVRKADNADPLTERYVRQTITDIYAAKIKDDMSCMRCGKQPHEMPEYVYLYYRKRFGLTHMREDHILELLASLLAYRDIPEVCKFAISAAVIEEDESSKLARPVTPSIPPREERVPVQPVIKRITNNVEIARLPLGELQFHQTTAATNEDIWKGDSLCTPRSILSARDLLCGGFSSARSTETGSSRLSTPMTSSRVASPNTTSRVSSPRTSIASGPRTKGCGSPIMPVPSTSSGNPRWSSKTVYKTSSVPIVKETKLLGMRNEELKHPLAEHLIEWKPLSGPTMIDLELLAHPLAEEATELVSHVPGIEALLAVLTSQKFVEAASKTDLGVPIGDLQLPQMHVLLEQACNLLDMDCPLMYVRDSPYCRAYTWILPGSPPAIIFNSAVFDILNPMELQALIAQQLSIIKWPKYRNLAMAWTVLILAPGLLENKPPPSGVKLVDGNNLRDLKWAPSFESGHAEAGRWPVSSALANSLDRWIRYQELVGDRAGLIVTESLLVVVSANMKMAAGSHTLAKQLNVEALLEQGHRVDVAVHSTLLREMGLQQNASAMSDNLNVRTEFTAIAHFNSLISKKTIAGNVSKPGQAFGVELRSLELGTSSHSLAVLRARELSRWAHTEEIAPIWRQHEKATQP